MYQVSPGSDALRATNGIMLSHLLDSKRSSFEPLPSPDDRPVWDIVLQFAVDRKVDAVIDVGALLAGRPLKDVARELTHRQSRPVVFFDNSGYSPGWALLNAQGQQWTLAASPVPEREAIVLFDQARCRGADLKLKPNALAMITLSADLCKDALIQVRGGFVGVHCSPYPRLFRWAAIDHP